MSNVAFKTSFSDSALASLKGGTSTFDKMLKNSKTEEPAAGGLNFGDMVKDGIETVDKMHKNADKMADAVASGKENNLAETMLAATQAELGFNLMVQIRNKGLEAYQEIMRMPV